MVSLAEETDLEVDARKVALDLAGAFSNDGFKIRDGHWTGMLKPDERALIAVNLYAGNQYWFTVGASDPKARLGIEVYDEKGQKVTTQDYKSDERTAAGFSPTNSGQYFVSVTLIKGAPSGVSLVYAYK